MVDPGFRIHVTDYSRSTTPSPSNFITKLRKHLKTRRLTRIALASNSRMLVLSFSDDYLYHLVFEFFSGGNMILLDSQYKILSLQRVTRSGQVTYAVGQTYDLDEALAVQPDLRETLTSAVIKSWFGDDKYEEPNGDTTGTVDTNDQSTSNPLQSTAPTISTSGSKKPKSRKKLSLKKLLYSHLPQISSLVIQQCLERHSIDSNAVVSSPSEDLLQNIVEALTEAHDLTNALVSQSEPVKGYIFTVPNSNPESEPLFDSFSPFPPNDTSSVLEFDTFSKAVDTYYSSLEASKVTQKLYSQQHTAEKRLTAAKQEKQKRVEVLSNIQTKSQTMGRCLELYANRVDEAIEAVKGLLNQGMDWHDIEQLIKLEKTRSNPVAQIISLPLNLLNNKITLTLEQEGIENEEEDDDDEDASESESESDSPDSTTSPRNTLAIEVDLALTAFANARKYYDVRREASAKQDRTIQQAEKAYKSAEKKIKRDLESSLSKDKTQLQIMHAIRQPFWFEKFFWFVSSDGYLCISGRDTIQNELLFRRYFNRNDVYISSDVTGSTVVIVQNHLESKDIPPSTIAQAGSFAISASSKAWESKMITSSWWARYDQIDKVTKDGEIVTTSTLEVKGGKNYLPPSQLDMGLGFMWLLNENETEDEIEAYEENVEVQPQSDKDQEQSIDSNEEIDESSDEDFPDTHISDAEDEETEDLPTEESKEHQDEESPAVKQPQQQATAEHGQSPDQSSLSSFKRLTAKERKELRKKRAAEESPTPIVSTPSPKEESLSELELNLQKLQVHGSKSVSTPVPPAKIRGKKGKLKKIAEKYADQDEEERQTKMELLGSTKGVERAQAEAEAARQKKLQQEQQERDRKLRIKRQQQAEIDRLLAETDEDEVSTRTFPFKTVVPRLRSTDKPVAAIPVFGPWGAMQRLKYKVKVQPGTVKKGKAVREFLRHISMAKTDDNGNDSDYAWPIELQLIANIKETELLLPIAVSKLKMALKGPNKKR